MVIDLVCEDVAYLEMIEATLPRSIRLSVHSRRSFVEGEVGDASVAVMVDEALVTASTEQGIARRARNGGMSIVLLRDRASQFLRLGQDNSWAGSVTLRGFRRLGRSVIRRTLIKALRKASMRCAATRGNGAGLVGEVIRAIVSAEVPIKSIAELAHILDCDRHELSRKWNAVFKSEGDLTVCEFLDGGFRWPNAPGFLTLFNSNSASLIRRRQPWLTRTERLLDDSK